MCTSARRASDACTVGKKIVLTSDSKHMYNTPTDTALGALLLPTDLKMFIDL